MEKKTDEIAVVKAAAWAWYQHGSGSEGKPMIREFDVTRTLRAPRVSRFKLESTINSMEEPKSPISSSFTLSPTKSDNSLLLDPYEIQSISKRLEYLIQSSNDRNHHGPVDDGDWARVNNPVTREPLEREPGERRKSSRKKLGMFWFRQAAICGSKGDVVEPRLLHGLRPVAHGSVFGRTDCRANAR